MGTPPWARGSVGPYPYPNSQEQEHGVVGGAMPSAPGGRAGAKGRGSAKSNDEKESKRSRRDEGLARVAIGHGESEGAYDGGSGWRGARAEEPIRVTVVYFVTPVGEVTRRDMESFTAAFESWDGQAIWGGSFVTKEGD